MKLKRLFCGMAATMMALGCLCATAEESKIPGYAEQLPAFVNQVSVWKPKAKASYAYTDLDQNGYLEILTSFTSKKGKVTNEMFALIDGWLVECVLPWEDEQTELKEDSVPVYHDAENGVYYYLFGTTKAEENAQITALWLDGSSLKAEVLTEAPGIRFAGMEKMIGSIGWINTAEHTLKDAPLEQISELAGESLSKLKLYPAEE